MKTIARIILTTALFVGFNSLQAQTSENRTVTAFTKIDNNTALDIVLEKGSKENVVVEVTEVDPKKILTEVKNNTLSISLDKTGMFSKMKGKITVTYVSLTGIESSGSGDITCKSGIETTDFALNNNGSGDIHFEGNVQVSNFSFHHKGSGDVELKTLSTTNLTISMMGSGDFKAEAGNAKNQIINISGSGDVQIENVTGESCTVAIKGSGDVKINVNNSLQGSIMGSGNISYKGDPKIKQVDIMGSGEVVKL
jgi:hypothetical protein